ncbi:restriction endonuclease [Peribacillus asahii]|uniref:restriction endonuclease n=1 Tax=Peribacillus asahii TaxID=228899 RepID=UPI00382EF5B0
MQGTDKKGSKQKVVPKTQFSSCIWGYLTYTYKVKLHRGKVTSLFNFIKEATNAVITKKENLKIIEDSNEKIEEVDKKLVVLNANVSIANQTLDNLEKKKEKLNTDIKNKEKVLQTLKQQESKIMTDKWNLEQEIEVLNKKHQELLQINKDMEQEIDKKESKISYLNEEINLLEESQDPDYKKRKSAARLCSALKTLVEEGDNTDWYCVGDKGNVPSEFSYPYLIDLGKKIKKNVHPINTPQTRKSDILKKLPKPKRDKKLDDLMEKFNDNYNCYNLIIPTVIDHLIECIDKNNRINNWIYTQHLGGYSAAQSEAWDFYKNDVSIFFKLLTQKDYPIEKNEGFYLEILKEKVLEKNYRELEDEFYLLLQLDTNNGTIEEVIHLFIDIVGSEVDKFKYLGFLNIFLVNKGYIESVFELDDLYELVKEELENYEVLKLERELFKSQELVKENKLTFKNIEQMTGVEFEYFLVELLQNIGYRAEVTKTSGDQGVDIIAKKQGKIYAIQAKRYTGSVGNKAVQEVVSGKEFYGADISWVITNSSFTPSAVNLASKTNTLLWDGTKLKNMIEIVNV